MMSKVMLMNDLNERAGKLAWNMQNRWKRMSQWASLTSGNAPPKVNLLRAKAQMKLADLVDLTSLLRCKSDPGII
jgi:thioesterase domain-containing protein